MVESYSGNLTRADYPHFLSIPTRWIDNDVYHHVNNAIYYMFFDTVINEYLVLEGGLDFRQGEVVGLAVETHCQFKKPIAFPDVVDAGIRVGKLGNSSVRYEIGLFIQGDDQIAAYGYFVHVFVKQSTKRPSPIPNNIRQALQKLVKTLE